MEGKNYHQRLKELKLYSLERRRERYLIINAWQQIENIRDNILNLKIGGTERRRQILQTHITWEKNYLKLNCLIVQKTK